MRYIFYMLLFLAVLFVFFIDRREKNNFAPIPTGLLYSANSSSRTVVSDEVTNITVYKDTQASLPYFKVYSDLKLPSRFVVELSGEREDVSYVLSNASQMPTSRAECKLPASQARHLGTKKEKRPGQIVPPALSSPSVKTENNPTTILKEEKDIVFNFNILNNIIKASDRTFFFSGKESTINDLTARAYNITPWQNKDILKFQIINASQQYFFLADVSLYQQGQLLLADYYNDPVVAPGHTLDCIALINEHPKVPLVLKVTESGGKNRVFNVTFTAP